MRSFFEWFSPSPNPPKRPRQNFLVFPHSRISRQTFNDMRTLFAALLVLATVTLCTAGPFGNLPPFPTAPPAPSPAPNPVRVDPGEVRSNDGSWNNVLKPEMGMKGYLLRRQLPSAFRDQIGRAHV